MKFRHLSLVATLALAGIAFTGCAQAPSVAVQAPPKAAAAAAPAAPNYPPSVGQMVAATKKQIKTINLQQFKAAFDQKELGLIVDVRQEDEYEDGHIPGAINVPRGLIEFRIWKHVGFPAKTDLNTKMTLYCLTGGRCALATKSLQDMGFTNVTSADMKFEDWEKAGYPVAVPPKK
jgi:rhodanese-related sulfurtransferase